MREALEILAVWLFIGLARLNDHLAVWLSILLAVAVTLLTIMLRSHYKSTHS